MRAGSLVRFATRSRVLVQRFGPIDGETAPARGDRSVVNADECARNARVR